MSQILLSHNQDPMEGRDPMEDSLRTGPMKDRTHEGKERGEGRTRRSEGNVPPHAFLTPRLSAEARCGAVRTSLYRLYPPDSSPLQHLRDRVVQASGLTPGKEGTP